MICFFCNKDMGDHMLTAEEDLCFTCSDMILGGRHSISIVRQLMAKCHAFKKREAEAREIIKGMLGCSNNECNCTDVVHPCIQCREAGSEWLTEGEK